MDNEGSEPMFLPRLPNVFALPVQARAFRSLTSAASSHVQIGRWRHDAVRYGYILAAISDYGKTDTFLVSIFRFAATTALCT